MEPNCYITEFYPRGLFGDAQTQIDNRRTMFFMETIQEEEEEEDKDKKDEYLFNI